MKDQDSPSRHGWLAPGVLDASIGILAFSLTLPFTRLAVTDLNPWFVTFARCSIAGLLALSWLGMNPLPWRFPPREHWGSFALTGLGVVFGFPLCTSLAMQWIPASHGGVITGLLPLATAVAGAMLSKIRLRSGFWVCAVLGAAAVSGYALHRALSLAPQTSISDANNFHLGYALMFLAMAFGALGYAHGGRLSAKFGGPRVICAALVMCLPISLGATILSMAFGYKTTAIVSLPSWLGLAYVSVVSMWLGFFFWYKGLAAGGVAKISQIQLMQPFLTLAFASLLLDEPFELYSLIVAVTVIALVFLGRKLA